jgi:hypothetical protein
MVVNILSQATSAEVTIRLIERRSCDFVILYDSADMAAISHRSTDRAEAHRLFDRAVQIAELGFAHPAWRRKGRQQPITINQGD